MGAHVSSPGQRHSATSDLPCRRPWTPRLESQISPYEVKISPFIVEIKNKNQWKTRLNALNDTNKLLVIEFTAKWCEPCKFLEPKVEEFAAKYTGVEFVKIDVDLLTSAWMDYKLHTLPTIVFMKRGQELDRVVGVKIDELEMKLRKYAHSRS